MEKNEALVQNSKTESLINRVRALGYIVNTFNTDCGHECYIASSPDHLRHIFIIPDDVKYIYDLNGIRPHSRKDLYQYMFKIKGTLKVIGGKGLTSAYLIFNSCKAQSLDLRSLDTSNVTNMHRMFSHCETQSIDLRSFNTRGVVDMQWMFYACKVQSIDLSSFDTSNVTYMNNMFYGCKVQSLDLRSFNTRNVKDMDGMFYECEAQSIDLRSFDTSSVRNMHDMFGRCRAQIKVNDANLKAQLRIDGMGGKALCIK